LIVKPRRLLFCAILPAALAWISCQEIDGPMNEEDPGVPLEGLIVSEPRITAAASAANSEAAGVTYVSLAPGTLPLAIRITIRNLTTGAAATAAITILDGGFDPVAVAASAGDVLELTVTLSNGSSITYSAKVPPRRPPSVVRANPAKGRTDVALSTHPSIIFSEPLDPRSVSTTSVRLLQSGAPVAGSVALEPGAAWVATFAPATALQPGTTYELVVSQDVRDLDGDRLEASVTIAFTTGQNLENLEGRIAFVSTRDGSAYIYVANADGSGVARLTTGERPAWSRDGRRIAFERYSEVEGWWTYVMNADGSGLRRLARGGVPTWSPDGSRIAFATGVGTVGGGLFTMNADGSNVIKLIDSEFANPGDWVGYPAWSPDGKTIAFQRAGYDTGWEIFLMNADGSNLRSLWATSSLSGTEFAWSPDGSMIAFQTQARVPTVVTARLDGSELRAYVFGKMTFAPDWSPEGSQLLFSMYQSVQGAEQAGGLGSRMRIYAVSRENGSVQQMVPDAYGVKLPTYWDYDAVWSRARN
jgi:Tol biopolymer transport system component